MAHISLAGDSSSAVSSDAQLGGKKPLVNLLTLLAGLHYLVVFGSIPGFLPDETF